MAISNLAVMLANACISRDENVFDAILYGASTAKSGTFHLVEQIIQEGDNAAGVYRLAPRKDVEWGVYILIMGFDKQSNRLTHVYKFDAPSIASMVYRELIK